MGILLIVFAQSFQISIRSTTQLHIAVHYSIPIRTILLCVAYLLSEERKINTKLSILFRLQGKILWILFTVVRKALCRVHCISSNE